MSERLCDEISLSQGGKSAGDGGVSFRLFFDQGDEIRTRFQGEEGGKILFARRANETRLPQGRKRRGDGGDFVVFQILPSKDIAFPIRKSHVEAARILIESMEVLHKTPMISLEGVIVFGGNEVEHFDEMIEIVAGR